MRTFSAPRRWCNLGRLLALLVIRTAINFPPPITKSKANQWFWLPLIPWQSRDSMSTVAPPCSFGLLNRIDWHNTIEIESRDRQGYERFYCGVELHVMQKYSPDRKASSSARGATVATHPYVSPMGVWANWASGQFGWALYLLDCV